MSLSLKNSNTISYAETFISSLTTSVFAICVVYLLSGLVNLYFAYDFNIYARFNLSGVHFLTPKSSTAWTRDAIVTIYLSNAILSFFIGLAFMFLMIFVHKKSPTIYFFFVWMIVFSFGNAFGIFIEQGIAKNGIYEVSKVLDLGIVVLVTVVAVSIYFLYLMGIILGKLILINTPNKFKYKNKLQKSRFFITLFIPWLISIFIFVLLSDKMLTSQTIIFLLSIIILLPVLWINTPDKENIIAEPPQTFNLLDAVTLILLIIVIIILYFTLKHGIVLPIQL